MALEDAEMTMGYDYHILKNEYPLGKSYIFQHIQQIFLMKIPQKHKELYDRRYILGK